MGCFEVWKSAFREGRVSRNREVRELKAEVARLKKAMFRVEGELRRSREKDRNITYAEVHGALRVLEGRS